MIYQYVVTLKNERQRSIDIISVLILLVSALCFAKALFDNSKTIPFIFIVSLVLVIAGLSWNWFRRKKQANIYFSRILLIAGITWFAMPFMPWIGFPVLLL